LNPRPQRQHSILVLSAVDENIYTHTNISLLIVVVVVEEEETDSSIVRGKSVVC
jgi:hypothetical protein